MEGKYSIEKSTCELYKFRHVSGYYWADITIDSKGETGRIQIASDYGSWQHYWGACGMPFKKFLKKIGIHYFAGKVREYEFFDHQRTLRTYRERVLDDRRRDSISPEKAREIYDEIELLEDCESKDGFIFEMMNRCDEIMRYYDGQPDLCHKISPQFEAFYTTIWPLLMNEFEKEFDYEQKQQSAQLLRDGLMNKAVQSQPIKNKA